MSNLKGLINPSNGTEVDPDSRFVIGSDFRSYSGQNFARDANVVHVTGDETIHGNKTFGENVRVNGTFTALSSVIIVGEIVSLSANYLLLHTNVTGTPTEDCGIRVNRGNENPSELTWNETTDRWTAGVTGSLENIILASDLSGAVDAINIPLNSVFSTVETGSGKWNSTWSTVLASSAQWNLATSGGLSQEAFRIYSGQVAIDQHTQDLAITGKVSTDTYVAGQHTQDLAITGKLASSDFNSYSAAVNVAQHNQDLAITGKVDTSTYVAGQHTQDLAITGKVDTSTYVVGQHTQDLAITGKMARSDFESYSAQIAIDQHTQDLAITGKVSTDTYVAGQHTQDLAITGKMARSDFEAYSAQIAIDQHTQDLAITGKVDTSTYVVGQHTQDLAITGKVDTSTYVVDQHTQDLAITGKVSTDTYVAGQHTQDLALTGLRADVDTISGDIVNLSGQFMAGDTLEINYVPASGGYTAVAANVSGHFTGINNALIDRVTLTNYSYNYVGSIPTGASFPGEMGQRYYDDISGAVYDCVAPNVWVRHFVAKIW